MRNVLVFPDKTEVDFMYPADREIEVGGKLVCESENEVKHLLEIEKIEVNKEKRTIFYHLKY